jgi:EAL domain-containing protein (putative c-di-GMP-specific phosphodiesterase class I)
VDELTRLGSDKLQGYFFARPVPAGELSAVVEHPLAEAPTGPALRNTQE